MFSRAQVRRVLQRVPGKQRLGVYRFLPFFFVLGGTMEWIMIKVRVGHETFCEWGAAAPGPSGGKGGGRGTTRPARGGTCQQPGRPRPGR